ncbi:AraC-like DNA-binding protein [Chitinophaga skermanii]|uniref:AraC-like DNA-binding protein n=1 Tax=Chitinophaga skermanii TaxID=331697 RepID=A0A327QJ42_9BACT|nr:helix-turn-helix domain-containing protein [Chitinophaga skermanii]RAJ03998.1 AraC-like DNA-binding protein [Chitinophaga skermanii]
MSDKKNKIEVIKLPDYGQAPGPAFTVNSLCGLGPTFFEHNKNPHRHNFYSIYWIKKGKLTHTIDTITHEVSENTLFFVAPGQVHQLEFSEKVDGYMIAFHEGFMCLAPRTEAETESGLFFNGNFSSVITLEKGQERDFEWLVLAMMRELEERKNGYEDAFHGLLHYFLVMAARLREDQVMLTPGYNKQHNSNVFMQFRALIEKKYVELKNVSDYADLLHIKPVLLNEISKQLSGITAGEHIRNRIILEAQRLLYNTDMTAKEIAYSLGFEDPHYFSRFFKKYTNQTPLEFKEIARANGALL